MENLDKIPKKIHYCWLGKNEKPKSVQKFIDSWSDALPGYEILEWNEDNYNLEGTCRYVREAADKKKWAFVSDYIRLDVLNKYGGIYLDTDVEILKSFDDLLPNDFFVSSESKYTICTAVIGAKPNTEWIKTLMNSYENRSFVDSKNSSLDMQPNSQFIYEYFKINYGYSYNENQKFSVGNGVIFPSDYFSPINYNTKKIRITSNTHTIHHYSGIWKSPQQKFKDNILALLTRIIGEEKREIIKRKLKRPKNMN